MDVETKKMYDTDIEDGELSDNSTGSGYTPLERPEIAKIKTVETNLSNLISNNAIMDDSIEDSEDESPSSDSSTDSDDCLNMEKNADKLNRKKIKRKILLRVKPIDQIKSDKGKFKKYDIWTYSLQEDTLMENMRDIDVRKKSKFDRNVENYDYNLKHRLNGDNCLKRRLSNSGDSMTDNELQQKSKRSKIANKKNFSKKGRLEKRSDSSSSESINKPRHIGDLKIPDDSNVEEVAKEIAVNLCEEKDDLLLRIVNILGTDLSIELYKKTQFIEKDGGMMIINGKRRRTPGGVYLFLLKHHEKVSSDQKKLIFYDERRNSAKEQKTLQAINRDKKVEELKKCLSEKETLLKPLLNRGETETRTLLEPENSKTLSNPPPSPAGHDNSPEYRPDAINHVNDGIVDKPNTAISSSSQSNPPALTTYEDDFLDMHCDDMDLF